MSSVEFTVLGVRCQVQSVELRKDWSVECGVCSWSVKYEMVVVECKV